MNLKEYISKQQKVIEQALDAMLPTEATHPAILHKAMRYAVFSGGKRLRPILTLASAEAVNKDITAPHINTKDLIPVALSVEILHTYTLIHDDLPAMDDDDERRGKPTCHKAFGEANAILAGDALQALAFRLAAESPYQPERVVAELATAAGNLGVVGGQVADIEAAENPSEEEITFIHQHKTADLFIAAIRMGAIAANASDSELKALTRYAENIGMAFQIIDDIIDAADENDESFSCITLYGIEGAQLKAKELTNRAVAALTPFDTKAQPLRAIAEYMLERSY